MSCKIYTLEHPITGEVRYVGRTTTSIAKRLARHVHETKGSVGRMCRSKTWIKSLLLQGLRPVICEIDSCSIEDRKFIESYWIQQFKAWNFNLLNHKLYDDSEVRSLSYEELYGVDRALEIRGKISKNHLSKKIGFVSPTKGIPKTEEHKRKLSESLKSKKKCQ